MENLKHHEFKAEWVADEHGPAIMLTQSDDGYCEPQTILVHPWQFRATCEHFGILPSGDEQARRTIATLSRRLLALAERIADLRLYVAKYSDHEHADLHAEMVMLNALDDLAGEWAQEAQDCRASAGAGAPQDQPERPQSAEISTPKGTATAARESRPEAQPALL